MRRMSSLSPNDSCRTTTPGCGPPSAGRNSSAVTLASPLRTVTRSPCACTPVHDIRAVARAASRARTVHNCAMRAGTYSIVARDRASGELGVAVQSHWFAVGSVVTWASPGVGATATQSVAEVAHGPNTLARIADALDVEGAIAAVLADDGLARFRQVGAVDSHGHVAAHTGAGCHPD